MQDKRLKAALFQEEVHKVLARCAAELRVQLSCGNDELVQVQALLAEAIGMLTESLTHIHEQSGVLRRLASDTTRAQGAAIDTGEIAESIESDVSTAVRSLQCHDLVAQLLEHVRGRGGAVSHLLGALDTVSAQFAAPGSKVPEDERREAIRQGVREVDNALARLRERAECRPVRQHGLASGDIELFHA